MEPLTRPPRGKQARKLALSEQALADLEGWMTRDLPDAQPATGDDSDRSEQRAIGAGRR